MLAPNVGIDRSHGGVDHRVKLGVLHAAPQSGVRAIGHEPDKAQEHVVPRPRSTREDIPVILRQPPLKAQIVIGAVVHPKPKLLEGL